MVLKLRIIRNGRTILEIPLEEPGWRRLQSVLKSEFKEFDRGHRSLIRFFETLANETRFRMLEEMLHDEKRFSDFMAEMELNPKTVNENLKILRERKLVRKAHHRYKASPLGIGCFLTVFALRRIIDELMGELEEF
ncbi:MAG: ArsR family transcriptional regulator [Candidatus Hodarchaeota archaeon]